MSPIQHGLTPTPGVLDREERLAVERQFGVNSAQVVRDHVISHVLAAISGTGTDSTVFFGGTALSRTLLPYLRLSEDIDLIALGDRNEIADAIERAIRRHLQRTFGAVTFTPDFRSARHPAPVVMHVGTTSIQIQLMSAHGYPPWPTEVRDLEQRYSDAPPARMRVLTPSAFVASKLISWSDRGRSRDLYDLWALATGGSIDAESAELFAKNGPFTSVSNVSFSRLPTHAEWHAELSHQCRLQTDPQTAAAIVASFLADL